MDQRITVAIRIRPLLHTERFEPLCARRADDGQTVIINNEDVMGMPTAFQFDDVFDASDDQRCVYEQSVQELVDHALQGADVTVLTYGQTGSGKTFTILGSMVEQNLTEESGMFPRVFYDLFSYREVVGDQLHILFFISAIELYVEDVMDLLARRRKIKLRETPEETLIPGVNIIEVKNMRDVLQTFEIANTCRTVTSTNMNEFSSRSHALFFIYIFQVPTNICPQCPTREQLFDGNSFPINGTIKGIVRSRIVMVDLAGSERVKRSGVQGQAMVEAQSINKSLSALGTSINAMYMGNAHVPFRESRLTRLLKPLFLDKTSRLLLIGQISPPTSSAQESQGTLRFCDRVKALKVGKVTGFIDSKEEENYLRLRRQQEELTAELRIANIELYYKVQRPSVIAQLKNISVEQARNNSITMLRKDADYIVARKEQERLKELEAEEMIKRDKMVRSYAEMMNQKIEEYESTVCEIKKTKKSNKRHKEEIEAEQEIKLVEAKKAKKCRLKLEEKVEQIKAELQRVEQLAVEIDGEGTKVLSIDKNECDQDLSENGNAQDELVHMLLSDFCSHTRELNGLHELYLQRLGATQRRRSQVRRTKMLSSNIIMEGTLVYDIIDFMVDRAVDIAEKTISSDQGYLWNDIDGFSCILRSGERWYPPLLIAISEGDGVCEPSAYHNTTFLTSDESDEENSHHREEAGRPLFKGHNMHLGDGDGELFESKKTTELSVENKINREDAVGMERKDCCVDAAVLEQHGIVKEGEANEADIADEDNNSEEEEEVTDEDAAEGEDAHPGMQKRRKRTRKDQEYLMRVYDSPTLVYDLIKYLRGGTVMLKHGRTGKPHRRLFWVSVTQSHRKLLWTDPEKKSKSDYSSVDLEEVSYIQLGCFSKVFRRHPVPPTDSSFFRCFSIGLKAGGRTVDIVAYSMPDFEAWVVGLSNLVRVDPVWGGKLDITKETHFERLNCFEASLCESNYIYPTEYLSLKKSVLCIVSRTLNALEQCNNDSGEAFKLLRGIHAPAINGKGAAYLTKGELRFIGRNEIDIIRITKIWILFQQMNLVYDDNFVPATTFGITQRQ